jgi:hypothetical protein
MIAVIVPALHRPERVVPLMESLHEASRVPVRLLFILSPGDDATVTACDAAGVTHVTTPFPLAGGDYARKINLGIDITREPWILQASDDLHFHPGWDECALTVGESVAAGVVGTNDLGNPLVKQGRHATHSLIRRAYVDEHGTIDEPGKALHEGYWHCWVDNELIETAKSRRAYFAARRSFVEHLHPIWPDGKGGRKGTDDATYRRGQKHYRDDHHLYLQRRSLWGSRPR